MTDHEALAKKVILLHAGFREETVGMNDAVQLVQSLDQLK
jgi:hypothetical protein